MEKSTNKRSFFKIHFWDRLNVLRAGILGANDGIISVSGIVLGAAGANFNSRTLFITGISGMLAGACSMAGGEWMSVSTQHDVQEKTLESDSQKIEQDDLLVPLHAAAASFVSFIIGALIPLVTMCVSSDKWRVINTSIAMIIALSLNATVSTVNTTISTKKTIIRNIIIGVATSVITYMIGNIFHISTN
ncbi:VIT1/CCC1 transporter family protein [Companilactobacillus jidongensis]|uniref:VIT1/CCC1 transporter family protein n=1 Tax=Companilactobacillus jidongensis TaxID=2486006 RepID=UPI000F7AAC7D|nr:VIT1/CCC1 transporter family protein [Companilactobacillus jidongensis]